MRSMSIYDYLEIKHPSYVYLRIVPSNSIRNYNTDKIISLVAGMYSSVFNRIERINKKLFFRCEAKASYYIYMEKAKVDFYFIVPEPHYLLFKEKIIDAWSNKITIEQVKSIPEFSEDCSKAYQSYSKSDALSLSCDKRNNDLLSGLLNTLYMMRDGDKVGVLYNFIPYRQQQWRSHFDRTMNALKEDFPVTKNKTQFLISVMAFILDRIMNIALSAMFGDKKKKPNELIISDCTRRKREQLIVQTQILCLSQSEDIWRERNNLTAVSKAFECLDSDNKLIPCNKKVKVHFTDSRIRGVPCNLMSVSEAQNLVSCPGRELLEEHKVIESVKVYESPVPEELRHGYISLGMCRYKDSSTEAFLRDNKDQGSFPLVIFGEQGSGKSTYLANYVKDIQSRGEGAIVIDFIKNCELSDAIAKKVRANNLIVLDISDGTCLQGFGYNEIPVGSTKEEKLQNANKKAEFIELLVDALQTTEGELSSSMSRYLNAAANVVFLSEDASFKDVIRCLENHEYRDKVISSVPEYLCDALDDEISALKELDDKNKAGEVSGTRMSRIDGVMHRVNEMKKNYTLKKMFYSDCSSNVDMVRAMDEGKVVLVKIPESHFSTPYVKNVLTTYFFTKVWASMMLRSTQADPKRFHCIVDEIFQAHTAMQLLRDKEILPQTRKWRWKFVLSSQSVNKISLIDETLYSAGASYMFLKGSGKTNFNRFKEELSPYTLEDIESIPQYSSLNLINTEKGRNVFITKLPKP